MPPPLGTPTAARSPAHSAPPVIYMRLATALAALPHGASPDAALAALVARAPTVERLLAADLELLARDVGLDHAKLQRLALELALASTQGARTARELHAAHLAQNAVLSTGVAPLDALLGGGLQTGEVCELVGPPGGGKTGLCLAACAAQAETAFSALYLDTASGFRARRLHELLRQQRRPKHARDDLLGRRLRVSAVARLVPLVEELEALEAALDAPQPDAFHASLRLLVVDSVFSAVVAEGAGSSKSAAGAQLARLQQLLRRLAARHRLAILVTNLSVLAQQDAADDGRGGGRQHKPALGMAWQHTAHVRLQLAEPTADEAQPATRPLTVIKSTLGVRGVLLGESSAVPASDAAHGG